MLQPRIHRCEMCGVLFECHLHSERSRGQCRADTDYRCVECKPVYHKVAPPPTTGLWMTVEQAAAMCGYSDKWVLRRFHDGTFKGMKMPGKRGGKIMLLAETVKR